MKANLSKVFNVVNLFIEKLERVFLLGIAFTVAAWVVSFMIYMVAGINHLTTMFFYIGTGALAAAFPFFWPHAETKVWQLVITAGQVLFMTYQFFCYRVSLGSELPGYPFLWTDVVLVIISGVLTYLRQVKGETR